jgi:uncharacterized membrane protein YidH (DUF202 family)
MVNVYLTSSVRTLITSPLAMILIILSLVAALVARYRWCGLPARIKNHEHRTYSRSHSAWGR